MPDERTLHEMLSERAPHGIPYGLAHPGMLKSAPFPTYQPHLHVNRPNPMRRPAKKKAEPAAPGSARLFSATCTERHQVNA